MHCEARGAEVLALGEGRIGLEVFCAAAGECGRSARWRS